MPIPPRPFRRTLAAVAALAIAAAVVLAGAGSASAASDPVAQPVAGSPDGIVNAVPIGGDLYLSAIGAGTTHHHLYRFDGTTFTEVPGSPDEVIEIVPFGPLVVISAWDPASQVPVLWSYDPVSGAFAELPGSPTNPESLLAFRNELVFGADATVGRHLDSWNGAAFTDLTPSGTPSDPIWEVVHVNTAAQETLYFTATDVTTRLYSYSGGGAAGVGTTSSPGGITFLSEANNVLYFGGDDDADPSTPNVLMSLTDSTGIIAPVLFGGVPLVGTFAIAPFGGANYLSSDMLGSALSRFLGSTIEAVTGVTDASTPNAVGLGSTLYLGAGGSGPAHQLFAVNGTSGAAVAGSPGKVGELAVLNGALFFAGATDPAGETVLWTLVTPADAAPTLAATGLDGAPSAIGGGAALASLLAGLLLVRSRFVRKGRVGSQ